MNNAIEAEFRKMGMRAEVSTSPRQVSAAGDAPSDDLEQCATNPRIHAPLRRQGGWLFLPRPWLRFDEEAVLRHETIGDSDGHVCESLCRLQVGGAGAQKIYAKGSISRCGHERVWLPYWHQVVMDTAPAWSVERPGFESIRG